MDSQTIQIHDCNTSLTSLQNVCNANDVEQQQKVDLKSSNNSLLVSNSVCDINVKPLNKNIKEDFAVEIENVVFDYNKDNKVLINIKLQMPKGKIYALLGSNGCGKTTLLRLILGRLQPKSGSICVFGSKPNTKESNIPGPGVGYMPQNIALFSEFTIEEILKYYANIYDMNSENIQQRINDLIEILNLPKSNRKIGLLSSGQQRLVSMSVTLVHKPPLLILDEPTVGVDSLLRCRIWQYLENLCRNDGITVIITTHYIEEAKNASTVGFIHSGILLMQSNPNELLEKYNCETLEDVFLKLCRDRENIELIESQETKNVNQKVKSVKIESNNKNTLDSKHIKALLWKNCIRITRNPIILILYILLPIIQLILFSVCTGKAPQNIPIAIYNPEIDNNISQLFLNQIDRKMIREINFESSELAIDSVRNGKTYSAITFAQNFSESFRLRLLDPNDLTDEEVEGSKIKLFADMSNSVIGPYIHRSLVNSYQDFLQSYSLSLGYNPLTFSIPLSVEKPIYGTKQSTIAEFMAPGVIIAYIQMTQMLIAAFLIVLERRDGHLERALITGVKTIEILLTHIIMLLIGLLIQVPLLMIFAFLVYDIPLRGSVLEAFAIMFLQGFQGVVSGLLVSIISPNEIISIILVFGFVFPMLLGSGVFWPLEAMPSIFRYLSYCGPLTLPIDALRAVMLRGWTVLYNVVFIGYLSSLFYTTITFIIAINLF